MSSDHLSSLKVLEERLKILASKLERDNKSGSVRDEGQTELRAIMSEACTVARATFSDPNSTDIRLEILEATNAILDEAIDIAYDRGDLHDFLPSYAHTEDDSAPVLVDPKHQENMLGSMGDDFVKLMRRLMHLPAGKDLPDTFPKQDPFDSTPKPHAHTSPLARFRDDAVPNIPSSAPTARALYYGCCSVSSEERLPLPITIVKDSAADILLMTACAGYKQRDPFVCYYDLSSVAGWKGMPASKVVKDIGLLEIAHHIALDPSRKLLWAADEDRAKSFSYDLDNNLKAVHTLDCQRKGPLAVVDNGARILRGGTGGVDVWRIDDLPTHGPEDSDPIGEGEVYTAGSWRDLSDDPDVVEPSTGAPRTASIDFPGRVDQWHLPSWWGTGSTLKALTANTDARSTVVARDLQGGGKVTMRYIGHGGEINHITSSDHDPNSFLTASHDGFVRLFDVRQPLPQLTINCGELSEHTFTALYVHVDGIPVIFTGGAYKTQCIKVWDPRAKKLVYELATGNNVVNGMAWDAPRSTLYAVTECDAQDRVGYRHGYRVARIRDGDDDIHDHRGQPPRAPKSKRPSRAEGVMDMDDSDDSEEDYATDEDEYDFERGWPTDAYHHEKYFGYAWDCGDHRLIRYKFGLDADATVVPEYGDAYPGEEDNGW